MPFDLAQAFEKLNRNSDQTVKLLKKLTKEEADLDRGIKSTTRSVDENTDAYKRSDENLEAYIKLLGDARDKLVQLTSKFNDLVTSQTQYLYSLSSLKNSLNSFGTLMGRPEDALKSFAKELKLTRTQTIEFGDVLNKSLKLNIDPGKLANIVKEIRKVRGFDTAGNRDLASKMLDQQQLDPNFMRKFEAAQKDRNAQNRLMTDPNIAGNEPLRNLLNDIFQEIRNPTNRPDSDPASSRMGIEHRISDFMDMVREKFQPIMNGLAPTVGVIQPGLQAMNTLASGLADYNQSIALFKRVLGRQDKTEKDVSAIANSQTKGIPGIISAINDLPIKMKRSWNPTMDTSKIVDPNGLGGGSGKGGRLAKYGRGAAGFGVALATLYGDDAINKFFPANESGTRSKTGETLSSGMNILGGATSGAMMGSMAGPWGAVIGGAVGLIGASLNEWFKANETKPDTSKAFVPREVQLANLNAEMIKNMEAVFNNPMVTGKANKEGFLRGRMAEMNMDGQFSTGNFAGGNAQAAIAREAEKLRMKNLKESLQLEEQDLIDLKKKAGGAENPEEYRKLVADQETKLGSMKLEFQNSLKNMMDTDVMGKMNASLEFQNKTSTKRKELLGQQLQFYGADSKIANQILTTQTTMNQTHLKLLDEADKELDLRLAENQVMTVGATAEEKLNLEARRKKLEQDKQLNIISRQSLEFSQNEAELSARKVAIEYRKGQLDFQKGSVGIAKDLAEQLGSSAGTVLMYSRQEIELKKQEFQLEKDRLDMLSRAGKDMKDAEFRQTKLNMQQLQADIVKNQIGFTRNFMEKALGAAYGISAQGSRSQPMQNDRMFFGQYNKNKNGDIIGGRPMTLDEKRNTLGFDPAGPMGLDGRPMVGRAKNKADEMVDFQKKHFKTVEQVMSDQLATTEETNTLLETLTGVAAKAKPGQPLHALMMG